MQYDESDLDFVQRLMEHEGIFYFFEYAEDGHTLVLTDAMAKLKPAPGYETVPFHCEDDPARRDRDYLSDWVMSSSVRPEAYAHTDYDFEKPSLSLHGAVGGGAGGGAVRGRALPQPGAHQALDVGDAVAAIRREELQAPHVRIGRGGTVRGLASGCLFKLEDFPRDDQNDEYLVLRADYRLVDPEHQRGDGGARARPTASSCWWRRRRCPTGRRG